MNTDILNDKGNQSELGYGWNENAPRGGRVVLGRIIKEGATVPMFLGQTLINSLRDLGYNDTTSAVCEHVDNGIQWKAKEIRVYFNQRGSHGDTQVDVLIVDNGVGMAPNVLKLAMAFGGSMVYNDRKGIGRYGMGMKTAALSMGKVLEVYSWQEPKAFYNMTLDVEDIGNNRSNQLDLPDPIFSSELPEEIVNILTKPMVHPKTNQQLLALTGDRLLDTLGPTGTIVYIPNCDRLTHKKASTLADHTTKEMARVYRKKISAGIKILVNNRPVEPFDPTFCMQDARHTKIEGLRATQSRLVNSWHDEDIRIPAIEGSLQTYPVAVRLYVLPYEEWMDLPRKILKNDLQIFEQHSVSFMRNDREVYIGSVPELSGKRHGDTFWFRLQIDFPGELDEAFGVAANKQGVRPKQYVYDLIKGKISDDVARTREAIQQFRTSHNLRGGKSINEAEKRASETDGLQTRQLPVPAPRTPEEAQALEDNLKAFAVSLKREDETDEQVFERVKKSKYITAFKHDAYWPFYHVEYRFGKVVLTINTAHSFFIKLYEPLDKFLRTGSNNGDDEIENSPNSENSELLVNLQLLLLSLARTQSLMSINDPEKESVLEDFRKEWSNSLQKHLMSSL